MLVETNVSVAVAVLNADNQVANNRHARAITKELLVCRLRIILLSLYELVVEVNVIPLALLLYMMHMRRTKSAISSTQS